MNITQLLVLPVFPTINALFYSISALHTTPYTLCVLQQMPSPSLHTWVSYLAEFIQNIRLLFLLHTASDFNKTMQVICYTYIYAFI